MVVDMFCLANSSVCLGKDLAIQGERFRHVTRLKERSRRINEWCVQVAREKNASARVCLCAAREWENESLGDTRNIITRRVFYVWVTYKLVVVLISIYLYKRLLIK